MARLNQLVFALSLLGVSWLGMMTVHELGHVMGAMLTDGKVQCMVLHPFRISRTDVWPNPHPLTVVWLGPVLGCLIPVSLGNFIPCRYRLLRSSSMFFAGFCLLANGAYIGFGTLDGVGDCGVMLKHGSPAWLLIAFGLGAAICGLNLWHRLGSLRQFLQNPQLIPPQATGVVVMMLLALIAAGTMCFSG